MVPTEKKMKEAVTYLKPYAFNCKSKQQTMKSIATLILFLLFGFLTKAQKESSFPEAQVITTKSDSGKSDTTKIEMNNKKIIIITEGDFSDSDDDCEDCDSKSGTYSHWAGVDFGVNYLMLPAGPDDFDYSWMQEQDFGKSIYWSLNLWEYDVDLVKDHVKLITGGGFSFVNHSFAHNKYIQFNEDATFAIEDTVRDYSKNRMRATYFNVPLMIAFNSHNESLKGVHFAAGVTGGVRLGTTVRRKWFNDGDKIKSNEYGTYNMNRFTLDASARIGIGSYFTLFANYNLLPMFDTNKAAEVYNLSAGIRIIPWHE